MDFGFNAGMDNPFTSGLLAMVAAQDPAAVASAAASVGIPPPVPQQGQDPLSALAQFMTPSASPAAAAAAPGGAGFGPAAGTAGAANPLGFLQALKGFQAPKQQAPIMSAGISGAQKAPEPNVAAQNAGAQALLQLVQGLTQHKNVGSLGSYIGV